MANKFIEVTGEGEYLEQVVNYILDVTIEVRAKTDAMAVEETQSLKDTCIQALLDHGITEDEIIHGGLEVWRPWYQKKKVDKYAQYKLTLQVGDRHRLGNAVEQMAKLFDEKRLHVAMTMRHPQFEEKDNGIDGAVTDAYKDALRKATLIASQAGEEIGTMTKAVEMSKTRKRSNSKGDADDGRSPGSIGFSATPGAPDPDAIPSPERKVWVTYKFTFDIKKEEPPKSEDPKKKEGKEKESKEKAEKKESSNGVKEETGKKKKTKKKEEV